MAIVTCPISICNYGIIIFNHEYNQIRFLNKMEDDILADSFILYINENKFFFKKEIVAKFVQK